MTHLTHLTHYENSGSPLGWPLLFLRLRLLVLNRVADRGLGVLLPLLTIHGDGLAGDEVTPDEGALLLEGLAGQVVQLGSVRTEADVDTLQNGGWVGSLGSLDAVQAALHVLGGGVEDADAVQLDGHALAYQFGDALTELGDDTLHDVTGEDGAVVRNVLTEATSAEYVLHVGVAIELTVVVALSVVVSLQINLQLYVVNLSHNL